MPACALAALDSPDVGAVDLGLTSQFFLAQPLQRADLSHSVTESLEHIPLDHTAEIVAAGVDKSTDYEYHAGHVPPQAFDADTIAGASTETLTESHGPDPAKAVRRVLRRNRSRS